MARQEVSNDLTVASSRGAPSRRAFLDTPDGQIHYRLTGAGEPPFVLLHQTARSSDDYAELAPLLARTRRVVAMDTLGYGDSDQPARWCTIEDYARTVIMLLDELGSERACIVGHHTGSKTAVEVAAAYPERVEKLVLLGPFFWKEDERERGIAEQGAWQPVEVNEDGSHVVQLWRESLEQADGDVELARRVLLDGLKAGEQTLHRGHWASASYQQQERLPLIRCPTLVVWGRKDIEVHDHIGFHTRGLVEAIPDCHAVVLEGERSGGSTPFTMPEEVARLMLDFVGASGQPASAGE